MAVLMKGAGMKVWRRQVESSFRVRASPGKARPDFVFRRERVAVFVEGSSGMSAPSTARGPNVDDRNYRASLELAS
jgi:hypothetical protein